MLYHAPAVTVESGKARRDSTPAQRWVPAVSGSRASGRRVCQQRCARGAAHRGSRRVAREATRHARGRSAHRPAPSVGAPAADHAAALWQLCCRIGHDDDGRLPGIGSRARCHRVRMATIAERGANAGTARRAPDGRRAYPANRHRVCIGTRSGVRRLTILVPIGAAFGHGTRTRTLSRTLTGREASKCAVRRQIGRQSQT